MVKIQSNQSADDRFEQMLAGLCAKHAYRLDIEGWARKTFDIYAGTVRNRDSVLLVRVESFALQSGEIRVYDDRGLPIAQELGELLERDFGVAEAVVIPERLGE
jgi:hypothetical protein